MTRFKLLLFVLLILGSFTMPSGNATPNEEIQLAIKLEAQSDVYVQHRQYAMAEPLRKQALAIREKLMDGPNDIRLVGWLRQLADLYEKQGKFLMAQPLYKRALAILEKDCTTGNDPDNWNDVAASASKLANLYYKHDQHADAEPLYKHALDILDKNGTYEACKVDVLCNLGGLYYKQGKYAQAEPLLKRLCAYEDQPMPATVNDPKCRPYMAEGLRNLAATYSKLGKTADAEVLYKRILKMDETWLGDSLALSTDLDNYASLLRKTQRVAEASKLEARARDIRARVSKI